MGKFDNVLGTSKGGKAKKGGKMPGSKMPGGLDDYRKTIPKGGLLNPGLRKGGGLGISSKGFGK